MSKNTKIIAIVGGILILGVVAWTVMGGGFGQAFEAIGCGPKKQPKRAPISVEAQDLSQCYGLGYACQRDDKGIPKTAKGAKVCDKKPAAYCKQIWTKACKDANYAKENKAGCKKFAAPAKEKDEDE